MDCIATAATVETAVSYPANNDGPVTYREYTELPAVSALSGQWDKLVQCTTCNRAFSSAAWFLSACNADPSFSPCVIAAWCGPQLVGILPLVLVSGAGRAEFPPPGDYNDIIARPDDNLFMEGMLNYALGLGKTLSLKNVRLDSNCYRTVAQARPDLVEKRFHIGHTCFYINLHTSYDNYLASRSKNLRKDLRYQEGRARRDGLAVVALSPDGFAPERLPELFLSLNSARFQEKGSLQIPARQAFVRAAFPELFRQGRLKPFVLTAGGRVIAIDICLSGPCGLCAWNGGFLPEAEEYSPGKLLLAEQLRQSFGLGMEEYDWLQGDESYKSRWATDSRPTGRFDFEPGFALRRI
jgi:CelD/BcsL family acetyltransferase involved in cellulose biosynthesis